MNNNFFKKNQIAIIISIAIIVIIATIIYFIKSKDVKQNTKGPLTPSHLELKNQIKIKLEKYNEDKTKEINDKILLPNISNEKEDKIIEISGPNEENNEIEIQIT
ncbi:MAG: hypothetical protein ACN23H_02300 [Candidatus Phytoplasma vitis]|nr:MAG: hypothetical protein M6G77_01265 [Candidatus Phytoplasma vitis]